jgi:hypothetical protein
MMNVIINFVPENILSVYVKDEYMNPVPNINMKVYSGAVTANLVSD